MSDCCHVSMTCLKADKARLLELLGLEANDVEDVWEEADRSVTFSVSEANYGLHEARQAAANKGIPWEGYHGNGCGYGDHAFVCDGKIEVEVECNYDGCPTIRIRPDHISIQDIAHVAQYWALFDRVHEILLGS